MSLLLGDMLVRYKADVTDLTTKSTEAKKAITGVADAAKGGGGFSGMFSSVMGGAGAMLSVVSGAFIAIGGIALKVGGDTLKMAGDFQESMTQLVTGAGESQANIGMVSQGILNMAGQTGTATKDLAAGMYMIESAGYHGKAGLDVLQAAAEGAKVGAASLADVANGVTTAMTDYASSGLTAAQATNELIATVANGKVHMGDLANSLANILPTASAAHVGLTDVMGAMSTMTGEGIPAAQAATYLRQTIIGLQAPSAGTAKALSAVGLSSTDVANEMKVSLPGALQMITDAVGKKFPVGSAAYVQAIKNISGGSKTMQGMLDLTGDHLKTFLANVGNVGKAVKDGGTSINGWAEVQKDFNFQMDKARASVEALGIKVGTALLPIATQFMSFVSGTALPILSRLSDWFAGVAAPALQTFATTIQTFVQPAIQNMVGLFSFLNTSAQQNTLEMQLKTVANTLEMAKKNVAAIEAQRQGIEDQLEKTSNAHEKAFLLMQLNALNISDQQAKGVVANYEKQRQGVQNQLDALDPQVQLSALKTKDVTVSNAITMAQRTIAGYAQMRAGLEQQLSQTTDETKRDALQRQIAAIDAATKQQQGVVKQAEQTRQGIEDQMKKINGNIGADSANPFINAWKGALKFIQGIDWPKIFGNINAAVTNIETLFKSVDWGGLFRGLWSTLMDIVTLLVTQFAPTWRNVADEWTTTIAPSLKQLNDALTPVYPILKFIVALDFVTFIGRLKGTIKAIAGFISGFVIVIGGIVLMITGWVQIISGFFQFMYDFFTGNWKKLGSDLGLIWEGIQNVFKGYLTTMAGEFLTFWYTVSGYVSGFCDSVIGFFQNLFDKLVGHSIVPDLINKMIQWFKNLGPAALSAVGDTCKKIADAFTGLVGKAAGWGSSLISGVISGIGNMMGSLGNTMQNVAAYIGSFLPHSPAKQGELARLNEYGPAFVKGFADGILRSQPVLKTAMQVLVSPTGQAVAYPINARPGMVASALQSASTAIGSSGGQGQTFILEVDSVQLAKVTANTTDRLVRLKLGAHGRAV